MGLPEKLAELEAEYAKTQKNKATEFHLGLLKAKMAKLKRDISAPKKGGAVAGGFDVKKTGNASVVLIGLPSVGKSTILNALTGSKSKTASYAFTTLSCIPGVMKYKGALIQILDLPGIIAGANTGKGRGKEVLAVARNADLVLLVLDVFQPTYRDRLIGELEGIGIRVDQEPPNIFIHQTDRGGININYDKKPTHLNDKIVMAVLNEYGIFSANVSVREDATVDQFIDAIVGNRKYVPSLTVMNKVDLVKPEFLKSMGYQFIPISADRCTGVEELKEAIFKKLRLIRVFTKSRFEDADLEAPLLLREGSKVIDSCEKLHRDLKKEFKSARIWGPSAKHPGQKVGGDHILRDGDIIFIEKK